MTNIVFCVINYIQKEFIMKKYYVKYIIGVIMILGGGRAFAQSGRYPEIRKEIALKYVNELNQPRGAKLDTIYKYRNNNLYNLTMEYLKEQNKLCAIATKRDGKEIFKLCKKLGRAKTESERESVRAQLDIKQIEYNQKHEYYNNIKDMYIDDAFIKCLMYAENIRRR